jgi:hypothetical protein
MKADYTHVCVYRLDEFNKSFCWFSRPSFIKFHELHFIAPHFTVIREE